MSHPDLIRPECWLRTFPTGLMGIMSCHWTDVERGKVVPKRAGQIFQFVDLNGFWMYTGDPEPKTPEPVRSGWVLRILTVLFLVLLGTELVLAWILYLKMKGMGLL